MFSEIQNYMLTTRSLFLVQLSAIIMTNLRKIYEENYPFITIASFSFDNLPQFDILIMHINNKLEWFPFCCKTLSNMLFDFYS
jgi:hypothetical protein